MSDHSPKSLEPTLNKLLNGELRAAHIYLQAGAWCADRSLDGCSKFLLDHASEELLHMRKFVDYMIDIDMSVQFSELSAPKIEVEHVRDLFQLILEHERLVTRNIHAAVAEAQKVGDQGTYEYLQWFVMEQREEEKTFRDILDKTKLIGEGPHSLYYIDREVSALAALAAASSGASAPA